MDSTVQNALRRHGLIYTIVHIQLRLIIRYQLLFYLDMQKRKKKHDWTFRWRTIEKVADRIGLFHEGTKGYIRVRQPQPSSGAGFRVVCPFELRDREGKWEYVSVYGVFSSPRSIHAHVLSKRSDVIKDVYKAVYIEHEKLDIWRIRVCMCFTDAIREHIRNALPSWHEISMGLPWIVRYFSSQLPEDIKENDAVLCHDIIHLICEAPTGCLGA